MLRNCLDSRTVMMIAQVQKTSTNDKTLLTMQDVGEMGFDFLLFGVASLQYVVGTLESTAHEFLRMEHPVCDEKSFPSSSQLVMADFATVKQVVGFGELEEFENNFSFT